MEEITDILPLIPQRPPFVMISSLLSCSEEGAVTGFNINADNIFIEKDQLGEPALVENIAQTAAARMGYICQQENKAVPVGFIGAVQNLEVWELPKTGDTLHTEIIVKNQIFNATLITGTIKSNDRLIAQCDMKIFIT